MDIDKWSSEMSDAISEKNEDKLKALILVGLDLFLKGEISKEDLEDTTLLYLTIPIDEKWKDDFPFKDNKFKSIVEDISAISVEDDATARKMAEKFKLELNKK